LDLDKLFLGEEKQTYKEQMTSDLIDLQKTMEEINSKTISRINYSRTASNAFYDHFENFGLVMNSSNFISEFDRNFKTMIDEAKKYKGPGFDLITSLYDFWMKSFKDLISEIWKYSSKYTLNFFKKQEPYEESNQPSQLSDLRSESSNTIGSKDKRKGWTKE
jgi:hypothetical protein